MCGTGLNDENREPCKDLSEEHPREKEQVQTP